MAESENPMRDRLKAACSEYETATFKPTINALAKNFGLHPQILTGALMAYEAIPDPKSRGPRVASGRRAAIEAAEDGE